MELEELELDTVDCGQTPVIGYHTATNVVYPEADCAPH